MVWTSSDIPIPAADQPQTDELRDKYLAVKESALKRNLLGAVGQVGRVPPSGRGRAQRSGAKKRRRR